MGLTWTIEKERKFQKVYDRLLIEKPELAQKLLYSRFVMYDVPDWSFWAVLKQNQQLKKAIYQRRVRINRYVRSMRFTFEDCIRGNHSLFLVTLTFDDYSLAHNELKSLKQAVTRFMSANCLDYIGCADYGKKNGRLHFHFICVVEHSKLKISQKGKKSFLQFDDPWPYGFHNVCNVTNLKRQFYYAMKLSNYCFKNENSDNRPFHKRGVAHWLGADDYEQDKLIRELEARFSCQQSSGFEVSETKTVYQSPSVVFGDSVYLEAFTRSRTEMTQESFDV